MATSFYGSAFFGGEFFFAGPLPAPAEPFSGGGTYRYFKPILPREEKRQIDEAIRKELLLRTRIEKVQSKGTDVLILESLNEQLRELQILILKLALESEAAYTYIQMKRQEEDEEISILMSLL